MRRPCEVSQVLVSKYRSAVKRHPYQQSISPQHACDSRQVLQLTQIDVSALNKEVIFSAADGPSGLM